MFASYLLGRKFYPFHIRSKLGLMIGSALILYWASAVLNVSEMQYGLILNVLFLIGYVGVSWVVLRPDLKLNKGSS